MIVETSYLAALVAGLVSFISPCVLPLVPPYLCYMAGVSLDQLTHGDKSGDETRAASAARKALLPSLFFVLGFSVVFISLGAGASTIGSLLRAHMDTLAVIAGIVIIIMGLHFLGVFRIGLLFREARFQSGGAGLGGAFVMGLAFAFGWTPCIGPVLGTILALASSRDSVGEGALLLGVYSAGLGIPFLLAAAFVGPFMAFLMRFRRHLDKVEKAMGALLVLAGLLFLTGGMQTMSFWLLEQFPALGQLG
ncbi:MAG: cytochrome c biogenesis protein CcdA [Nitratireductor sp.]